MGTESVKPREIRIKKTNVRGTEHVMKVYPFISTWEKIKARLSQKQGGQLLSELFKQDATTLSSDMHQFLAQQVQLLGPHFADAVRNASQTCRHLLDWILAQLPLDVEEIERFTATIQAAVTEAAATKTPTDTFVPIADTKVGTLLKNGLVQHYFFLTSTVSDAMRSKVPEEQTKSTALWQQFLATMHTFFLQQRDDAIPAFLSDTIVALRKKDRTAYRTALKSIIAKDNTYHVFVERAQALSQEIDAQFGTYRVLRQATDQILTLYQHAQSIHPQFMNYLHTLANKITTSNKQVNVTATVPDSLKGLYRVFEKTAFIGSSSDKDQTREGTNLFDCSGVFDVVRGALQFDSMSGMVLGINFLASDQNIKITRVKDRFGSPTSAGWADCLVNAVFVNDTNNHIFEIQLISQQMMWVRSTCGAHHTYNQFRTAMELLQARGLELPGDEDVFDIHKLAKESNSAGIDVTKIVDAMSVMLDLKLNPICEKLTQMEERLKNIEEVVQNGGERNELVLMATEPIEQNQKKTEEVHVNSEK